MSLYDDASLIAYPSGYKESKIYAQKPVNGTGDLTFTRASSATRVNAEGLIETATIIEDVYASNFSSGADGWISNDVSFGTVTGSIDSIGGVNDTLRFSCLLTVGSARQFKKLASKTIGKNYIITYSYYLPSTNTDLVAIYSDETNTRNFVQDTWTTVTEQFTAASTNVVIPVGDADNYLSPSTVGDVAYIKNVVIKEVITSNVPRIDYSNGCGSLLLEPQRTNSQIYSQDFTNATYIKDAGITINSTNNTSPSGALDATKISVTNSGRIYSNTASNTWCTSVFLKAGTFAYFELAGKKIDLNLGTMVGGTIEDYGNGWYRVTGIATTIRSFQIVAYPNSSYAVHTTSGDYFIWGVQSELSATYPTSYIPTLGTAVTRIKDSSSTTGLSSVINSTEGVLYAEIAALADDLSFRIISISDGTTNNNVGFGYRNSSNVIYTFVQAVINSSTAVTVSDITAFNKVAIKYKSGDFAMWINGVEVYTSATAFTLTGLNQVSFDNGGAAANFFGNVQNLMVFDSALTDTELATLTTI